MQSVSYGSFRPLAVEGQEGTPEASAFNRRIDIVILPYKNPDRSNRESGFGLPETRIPGSETRLP